MIKVILYISKVVRGILEGSKRSIFFLFYLLLINLDISFFMYIYIYIYIYKEFIFIREER